MGGILFFNICPPLSESTIACTDADMQIFSVLMKEYYFNVKKKKKKEISDKMYCSKTFLLCYL